MKGAFGLLDYLINKSMNKENKLLEGAQAEGYLKRFADEQPIKVKDNDVSYQLHQVVVQLKQLNKLINKLTKQV